MTTFILIGKYSSQSLRDASAKRTEKVLELVGASGGKVSAIYALLGAFDIVIVTEFPDVQAAMNASLSLNKTTGIAFETFPAVSVKDFDAMIEGTSQNPSWR